jgi:hypothetical protein
MNGAPHEPERGDDVRRLFQQTDDAPEESDFVHQVTQRLHHRRWRIVPFIVATLGLLVFVALRLGPAGDALLAASDQFVSQALMPTRWGLAAFMLITIALASVVSAVTRAR